MKKFMLFVSVLFIMSITATAQTYQFKVFETTMINQETGETHVESSNFNIKITDYNIYFVENGLIWTFTGETIKTTPKQFYSWAIDMDGTNCKIWFNAINSERANIGIEYKDLAFVYKTYLVK